MAGSGRLRQQCSGTVVVLFPATMGLLIAAPAAWLHWASPCRSASNKCRSCGLGRSLPVQSSALRRSATPADQEGDRSTGGEPLQQPDWREFRATLVEKERRNEEELTVAADAGVSVGKSWLHVTPLIEKGSVLLAKPGTWALTAPSFHKAVILVVEHDNDQGSMGFVINRPTPELAHYRGVQFNVWYGGPCNGLDAPSRERLCFCLHRRPDLAADRDPVFRDVFLTDPWSAAHHVSSGKAASEEFILLSGHCGWVAGQLQDELDTGEVWLMVASDVDLLLGSLPRRQRALQRSRDQSGRAAFSRGMPLWRRLFNRASASAAAELQVDSDGLDSGGSNLVERHADRILEGWFRDLVSQEKDRTSAGFAEGPPDEILGTMQGSEIVAKILAFMAADPLNETIQENGCEALRHMVTDDESRSMVSAQNGIDSVLQAMRAHPDHWGVQGHCAGTLAHLAAGAPQREAIAGAGGLNVLMTAMKTHPSASLVQYKACGVLANFASTATEQLLVAALLGIEHTIEAMRHHAADRVVQDHCIGTLHNLAKGGSDNRRKIVALGGIPVVEHAVMAHLEAPVVQQIGLHLLQLLKEVPT